MDQICLLEPHVVVRACENIYGQDELPLLETAYETKTTVQTSRKAHPLDA